MRFLQLDDDHVLALDPQADQAGRRLVRLIAGNPVTMGQMTRHLPAAGSYAPVTILIQELPGGRNPGGLRHRRQRDRALRRCRRLPGRPAAGHRSPRPPAPRDRHTGHRNPLSHHATPVTPTNTATAHDHQTPGLVAAVILKGGRGRHLTGTTSTEAAADAGGAAISRAVS